jgi:hypothetical protein
MNNPNVANGAEIVNTGPASEIRNKKKKSSFV